MKYRFLFILLIGLFFCSLIVAEQRQINFSGYRWLVKNGYYGPGPNYWNDSKKAVYQDIKNNLHLLVRKRNQQWQSSEIYLPASLGYGKYTFTVQNRVDKIDRSLVLGLFLYADDTREIDIELTRWEDKNGENFQYVVQPFYLANNIKRYHLKLKNTSSNYRINWQPEYIIFTVKQNNKTIYRWKYTGDNNFIPGPERVHINFWQNQGAAPYRQRKQEVVIENFTFTK